MEVNELEFWPQTNPLCDIKMILSVKPHPYSHYLSIVTFKTNFVILCA